MAKTTRKLEKDTIDKAVDIIRRRAYWREVGEALLLGIYKPEGFNSMKERAQPWDTKKKPGDPLTLGEVLARLPPEYRAKVLELDVEWLISLLAPPTVGDFTARHLPEVRAIKRPDHASRNRDAQYDSDAQWGVEVEPPRILSREAPKKGAKKSTKKATAKKSTKKATAKKSTKKATAKKSTKKKATAKKSTKKKATAKMKPTAKAVKKKATAKKSTKKKAAPPKKASAKKTAKKSTKKKAGGRRSKEQLELQLLALPDMSSDGLTRAAIRKALTCSGSQVKDLLERLQTRKVLALSGEGNKALWRFIASPAATPQGTLPGTEGAAPAPTEGTAPAPTAEAPDEDAQVA